MKGKVLIVLALFFALEFHAQKENSAGFVPPKEMVYKIVDGDTLKMQFLYPEKIKQKKAYPAIVFFFGGGWNGGTITQFEDQAKYFASRGMIGVLVDYRVKSRHGTTPFEAVSDAKSAMRFVRANAHKFHIDPNKIVASGGSAGGHLAAATATLDGLDEATDDLSISAKPNALVLYNPVIDNGPEGFEYKRMGGRHMEISPMHNIKGGTPPTIIFLGTKDALIPVATIEKYKTKMEAVGSRCDIFLYKDQTHGFFNKPRSNGEFYVKTTREADIFLKSIGYLKGKPKI
ncbi:alpha/beta hydrolase [Zobellia galactanivorans]|uniref:alpha/beta hydrolase n=1 Tax=Zobellia TaxID=112040 RepID=UPI000B52AFC6|nr:MULTISPECIES: alpha/beta hydrolase [Zobellia]MDO6809777.1 alpha/beta hydrolase [Zobellia galactanivorans]OWW23687.1 peptidase S9 [Zobellia sp. OII3]